MCRSTTQSFARLVCKTLTRGSAQDIRARHPRKTRASCSRERHPRKTRARRSRASGARPAQVAGGLLAQPGQALFVRALWHRWKATCATWPGTFCACDLVLLDGYLRNLAGRFNHRWRATCAKWPGALITVGGLLAQPKPCNTTMEQDIFVERG